MKHVENPTDSGLNPQWAIRREDTERRFLNIAEVAIYCGVEDVEVMTWIDSGELKASRVAIGHYRITVGDLLAFLGRFHLAL